MRHEFSAKTKRLALERAGGVCEATGQRYGLAPGDRCTALLSQTGVQHDHYPLGAHAEGSNTLENDVVCCPYHNQYAANHTDKRVEAKLKRIQRKHGPKELRKVKAKIASPAKRLTSKPFDKSKSKRFNGQVVDRT